jgi:phenylalanyl-tRNA synthetase beta chain
VNFDLLEQRASVQPTLRPVPRFPAVARDVAVVVAESVRWAELEACVRQAAAPELVEMRFFDVYRGRQIPPGKKSIAFSLIFRAPDRTLTGEEADAAREAVVAALRSSFGAEQR